MSWTARWPAKVRNSKAGIIRQLDPFEYFSLIGWSPNKWTVVPGKMPSRTLCSNLCGNARSAFAIGALVSVTLSVVGMVPTVLEREEEAVDTV